jgi:hypothetical protein
MKPAARTRPQTQEESGSMKETTSADFHHRDAAESKGGQMTPILDQLGLDEGLPVDAIRAADANRAAMVPLFLQAFERAETADPSLQNALFFAFHLLGQWREKSAYRPLAAFLRRPAGQIAPIISGLKTETAHQVMACLFDGDPRPLYEVIQEPEADEFIRARMLDALAMVTLRGELPREEAARFLQTCFADLQPQSDCHVWAGWQGAIAMLGLSELKPLVKQAFERGLIASYVIELEDFEQDLQRTLEGKPYAGAKDEYELFGDTIDTLSRWHAFAPKREKARPVVRAWQPPSSIPAVNPLRSVGRNDPCPCGSGKKFKKCCLGKSPSAMQSIDEQLDFPAEAGLDIEESFDFDIEDSDGAIDSYDPLVAPDPVQWLMLDEQERIDLVLAYHRRAGLRAPGEELHATIHVIVENQIADDELPVSRKARRLMSEGLDRHDAIHAIGSVLAGHIYELTREVKSGKPQSDQDPNKAYFAELERLTAKSWRRSA